MRLLLLYLFITLAYNQYTLKVVKPLILNDLNIKSAFAKYENLIIMF